jgi:hypothetical protein
MSELEALLTASVEIAKLKRENGLLRLRCDILADENASLRRCLEGDADFELTADGPFLPPPFTRQAE